MVRLPVLVPLGIFISVSIFNRGHAAEYEDALINLARTNLASVEASNVNGERAMDNPFHGILNAFDADEGNRIKNHTYTDWLGGGGNEWVDIRFSHTVKIKEIVAERAYPFSAVFYFEDGSEKKFGPAENITPPWPEPPDPSSEQSLISIPYWGKKADFRLSLEHAAFGVVKIRLIFINDLGQGTGNIRVREIKVLGSTPVGTEYRVQDPSIVINERTSRLSSQERFDQWKLQLTKGVRADLQEDEASFKTVFRRESDQLELFRVIIDKNTGDATETPLCELKAKGSDSYNLRGKD